MAYQPVCPCKAAASCSQMGKGSAPVGEERLHFRGEILIRSDACALQKVKGITEAQRDCPRTLLRSRANADNDPLGYITDYFLCRDCSGCVQPKQT